MVQHRAHLLPSGGLGLAEFPEVATRCGWPMDVGPPTVGSAESPGVADLRLFPGLVPMASLVA